MDPFGELEDLASSIATLTPESVTTTIQRRTSMHLFGDDRQLEYASDALPSPFGLSGENTSHLDHTSVCRDNSNNLMTFDPFITREDLDSAHEVSQFSPSARVSTRKRTLSEKGLAYHIDLQVKVLKSSMSSFKRLVRTYYDKLSQGGLNLRNLYDARQQVEAGCSKVADCFNKLGSYSVEQCNSFQIDFDQCGMQNRALLKDITDAIRNLTIDEDMGSSRSKKSANLAKSQSKVSASSVSARSSSGRSLRSQRSAKSMIMEAAAKAAELETKLRFVDEEEKHKAALGRLSLIRDLEAEKAKITAINAVESLSIKSGEVASGNLGSVHGVDVTSGFNVNVPHGSTSPTAGGVVYYPTTALQSWSGPVHVVDNRVGDAVSVSHRYGSTSGAATGPVGDLFTALQSPRGTTSAMFSNMGGPGAFADTVQSEPTQVPLPDSALNREAPAFVPQHARVGRPHLVQAPTPPPDRGVHFTDGSPRYCDVQRNVPPVSVPSPDQILFGELLNASRLPIPEPGVFCGDPLEFPSWRTAFATLIESRKIASSDKVYYLKRYLGGAARKCVEGYLLIPNADSYDAAIALIEKRFGSGYVVAQAFKQKIEFWSKIGPKDSQGLQEFSDFLSQCEVAARSNPSLRVLNDDVQNKVMLAKLPDWLLARWGRIVHETLERCHEYPTFRKFVEFLRRESDIACNPITMLQPNKSLSNFTSKMGDNKPQSASAGVGKTLNTLQSTAACILCGKQNHSLNDCYQFKNKSVDERKAFVMEKRLCFGCLQSGHISKSCHSRLTCATCKRSHPTALHGFTTSKPTPNSKDTSGSKGGAKGSSVVKSELKESGNDGKIQNQASGTKGITLFSSTIATSKSTMIVPVFISCSQKPASEVLTYALLDTQSDTSFVSNDVCNKLGVTGNDTTLVLATMTAESMLLPSSCVSGLVVRGFDSQSRICLPTLYTHECIPADHDCIPTASMADTWPHLKPMAGHLMPKSNCGIGLLLGYNCPRALTPRDVIPSEGEGPFAQRTDLGWGIIGLIKEDSDGSVSGGSVCEGARIALRTSAKEIISPHEVYKFFSREEGEVDCLKFSQDDTKFMKLMEAEVTKTEDNHYQMPLPFRDIEGAPPNNRVMAVKRLRCLVKRFERDSGHYEKYVKVMQGLLANGYAEIVPESELSTETPAYYLAHHGVYNPNKPGKLRVVMDASAKFLGISLNDLLLPGPDLMNGLVGVLCRFRQSHVALMCDIEGMFHQFRVNPEHRNFLRFLWFENDNYDGKMLVLRSTVHLFGAVSSPAVANFGLKRAASDNEDRYGPQVVKFFHENFYVDDGLVSVESESEAAALIQASRELCHESGLRLHKFISNSRKVLETIPVEDQADTVKELDLTHDTLPMERALGVRWCVESDTFQFRINIDKDKRTRRGILSTVCSIYDPLGFIAPVVLQGKLILQEMCREKVGWDDPLPDHLVTPWTRWLESLPAVESLIVERCFQPSNFGKVLQAELHCFSDASMLGYGQCTYIRLVDDKDSVHCSFVMAKSRVAPLKITTIPRLELAAAALSVEVSTHLQRELEFDVHTVYWTDNQSVLGYIGNETKRYHTYVANRIQKIRNASNKDQWKYVPTKENPADVVSRGCDADQLVQSSWITGPSFLWDSEVDHKPRSSFAVAENDPEVKKSVCLSVVTCEKDPVQLHFTSWRKARRVTAICLRFIQNARAHSRGFILVDDLVKAEELLVKLAQREEFSGEITGLRNSPSKPVSGSSSLKKLDPFLDKNGVLRVGGRLKQGMVAFELKHPVILPKSHAVTDLLVRHFHEGSHQGRGITTNVIRSHGYWILGMSSVVSKMVYKCVTCRKYRRSPEGQKMGDIPADRLEPGPAFSNVGTDYFGPFYIRDGRKEVKRYGVLFTCLSSRAIHLETANSLEADAFINAFRRFQSIRGPVRILRCDRGTNFVGGCKELNKVEIEDERVRNILLENQCDFIFNVPHASHQGGVWERQIRSVRNALNTLLGSQGHQLDDESFRTFMCEAANIVNSRPLTVLSLNDPTSPQPLTPNHLLTLKSNVVLPPPSEFQQADLYCRRRWRRVQYMANEFWHRWRKELLAEWQERVKWERKKRNMRVGDIVLIIDDAIPRCQWKMAKVTETYPGKDGLVRKVKLIVGDPSLTNSGSKVVERPIHKLIILLEAEN